MASNLKKERKGVIQKDCSIHTSPFAVSDRLNTAMVQCCTFEAFASGERNLTTFLELCARDARVYPYPTRTRGYG